MSGVRFGEEVLLRKILDIAKTTKDELKTRTRKVGNIHLGDIILPFIQYSNPKLKEVLLDVKMLLAMQVSLIRNKKTMRRSLFSQTFATL